MAAREAQDGARVTLWRCPVHRDNLKPCIRKCGRWRLEWLRTRQALWQYWYERERHERALLQPRQDKFTERLHNVQEIVEGAAA